MAGGTDKVYVDAREYLRDSWRLAKAVLDSGWKPDVLLALWRGGAGAGVSVQEFLKVKGISPRHMPVKCHSYVGIGAHSAEVRFEHADSVFAGLRPGEKVLVVDDVFDSGRTAAAVRGKLESLGCEMRMACVYWKPTRNETALTPDYHVREVDDWIVFPHEIEGLTSEEVAQKDPLLAGLLAGAVE